MSNTEQLHHDILTDLINSTNRGRPNFAMYPYGQLKFRNVRPVLNDDRCDTEAEFTSLDEPDDNQWRPLYYRRVSITAFIREPEIGLLYVPEHETTHDLLPLINAAHEIQFTEADILDQPLDIPTTDEGPFGAGNPMTYRIPIHAAPNALIIRGSTFVTLTL